MKLREQRVDPEYKYDRNPIVFIRDEGVMGVVIEYGTYASTVRYMVNGHMVQEYMDNDDFVIVDNILFKHYEED